MPIVKGLPRVVGRTLLAILGLVFAFVLVGHVYSFHARKRAEHLLRDLQTLNVGTSDKEDAMRIITRYGGWEMEPTPDPRDIAPWGIPPWSGPHRRFGIRVAPDALNRSVDALPLLRYLGFHVWGVTATIDVKDGKVLYVSQDVGFERSDGHEITTRATMLPEFSSSYDSGTYSVHSHFIRHYIHQLTASVLPTASKDEKSRAFRVELACATSFGGCYYTCELAPLVWDDLSQRSKKEGWEVEGENDPRCRLPRQKP